MCFIMRVTEDGDDGDEEKHDQDLSRCGTRFSCLELDFEDESGSEPNVEVPENCLMRRQSLLLNEDEIKNVLSSLEQFTTERIIVTASESALLIEEKRLGVYKKFDEMNSRYRKFRKELGFHRYERKIARSVKQMSGRQENFREIATNLINIVKDPRCPPSISLAALAKQIVAICDHLTISLARTAFVCGRIVGIVASEFPVLMDLILAEFHRSCIYTVPKHICHTEVALKTEESYVNAIGYKKEDTNIESGFSFLEKVEAYMTLYAALVQTEVHGCTNYHDLKEGWAWLARCLNSLPTDSSTATALLAFLKMAGFALHQKYRIQFKKILDFISREFLVAELNPIVAAIHTYLDTEQYLKEPEGWQVATSKKILNVTSGTFS